MNVSKSSYGFQDSNLSFKKDYMAWGAVTVMYILFPHACIIKHCTLNITSEVSNKNEPILKKVCGPVGVPEVLIPNVDGVGMVGGLSDNNGWAIMHHGIIFKQMEAAMPVKYRILDQNIIFAQPGWQNPNPQP